jgi:shikimate dehydrogenase
MPPLRLPILGFPLGPSLAEAIQRTAAEAAGVDLAIERWERKPHQLADAVTELRSPEFIGALIASPHKERIPLLLDALSDDARASGAANVVVQRDGRLRGHNTDMDGIRVGLAAILPTVQGKWPRQAVVLGAGGGARAVVAVLIQSGIQRIAVFNRHLHRAEALVNHLARSARHMDLRAMPWHETIIESELARAKLLVNATAIGVEEGESPIDPALLSDDLFVLDLVLGPPVTPLMRAAEERGGTVANGQASLLAASAVTFKLLTDSEAPPETLREALAKELGLPVEGVALVGD